ncbi:Copper-containing nitrite reductase [Penicillium chrysogenum]|uniref:Copper-containing nitrite reductase n=1 Tax=Penicillium chrysogenum TaxID=5076 RepID=A0A167RFS2_PENCH|nr:Copper-containing nitrite reductase [Penicillium chrysogenum]
MDTTTGEEASGLDTTLVPRGNETAQSHSQPYVAPGQGLIDSSKLPIEEAVLTEAPSVPPPITRNHPVLLQVPLTTSTKTKQLTSQHKYEQWNFNGIVPGPFIRARVGDVVELSLTNRDKAGNPHNIDCHAFIGPGGGSALTTAEEGQTKTARFRLHYPGLYLYHCAAAPVPVHIANGMYGLMYVEPATGDLPPADREYYVMQSEFYHEPPEIEDNGKPSSIVEFSYPNALREEPSVVVFNGHEAALTRDKPLKASVGEKVRIFFGNAGPNLTSSFHVIGSAFEKVYRDGDVVSPPGQFVQTLISSCGTAIVQKPKLASGLYVSDRPFLWFKTDDTNFSSLQHTSATHFSSLSFEQHPVPTIAGGKCAMTLTSPSSIKYLAKAKWLCLTAYRRTTAMCNLGPTGENTSTFRTPRLPLYATWKSAFFEVTLIFPVGRNEE